MQRIIIEFVMITVVCVLFGGCGEEKGQDMAADGSAYANISLYSDVNFWKPLAWDTAEGTITGEITKETGVTVDMEIPVKEADTRLKLMLLDDELPDVISIIDATTIHQLVTSGKVWKIDEFLEKYLPESHLLREFPEDIKHELIKRDGAWYAFPSHLNSIDARKIWTPCDAFWNEVVEYGNNNEIIWNKSLLEQLNIQIEGTVAQEDVFNVMEQAKKSRLLVGGEPIFVLLPDGNDYLDTTLKLLLASFGAEWVDEKGEYCDALLQPEAKDALRFLNIAVRRGYINPEHFNLESTQIQELARSGRTLCFIGNIADIAATEKEWVSTGVILSGNGSVPVMGKNLRAATGWMQTFIAKDCEHPEKIALWLDYMTSEEGKMLCHYGFPGEHYTVEEDGRIYRTKEGQEMADHWEETGLTSFWQFANTAWTRSKSLEGEINGELALAYGKYPETVLYDESLLMFPADFLAGDHETEGMEQEISFWKTSQILVTVLAQTDAAFEAEYQKLVDGLYQRGIEQLDAKKNAAYKNNCMEYHSQIEKINRGREDVGK